MLVNLEISKPGRSYKMFIYMSFFALAMGFLETAVVVYLRKLYYPDGFDFPLAPIDKSIAITELWREFATIVMLVAVGYMAGKTAFSRWTYFLYSFAVWDITYYIFLKVLLNWPESLLTWDILFLIPMPWVGPVLSPCMVAMVFVVQGVLNAYCERKNIEVSSTKVYWWLTIPGFLIVIGSFIQDYLSALLRSSEAHNFSEQLVMKDMSNYQPLLFNWSLFLLGWFMISIAALLPYAQALQKRRVQQLAFGKKLV